MATVKVKTNSKDAGRIRRRAEVVARSIESRKGLVFQYTGELVTEYMHAVVSGMGRFPGDSDAAGSLSYGSFSFDIKWRRLSEHTLEVKRKEGWSMNIWEATGDTKNAVKVYAEAGGWFAGIKNPDEYVLAVEFGANADNIPKRALFTEASNAFKANREVIYKNLRTKVFQSFKDAGWGNA